MIPQSTRLCILYSLDAERKFKQKMHTQSTNTGVGSLVCQHLTACVIQARPQAYSLFCSVISVYMYLFAVIDYSLRFVKLFCNKRIYIFFSVVSHLVFKVPMLLIHGTVVTLLWTVTLDGMIKRVHLFASLNHTQQFKCFGVLHSMFLLVLIQP